MNQINFLTAHNLLLNLYGEAVNFGEFCYNAFKGINHNFRLYKIVDNLLDEQGRIGI